MSDREFPRLTASSGTQRARGAAAHDGRHLGALFLITAQRPMALRGTSRGHGLPAPRPSAPMTPCTLQGMARVQSGQATAWPSVSDRSVRRGSGVKRSDFACTFTRHFHLCSLACGHRHA